MALRTNLSKYRYLFKRESFLLHVLPVGAVFISLLGLTIWASVNARHALDSERSTVTSRWVEEVRQIVEEKLETYEVILRGGASLFMASEDVSRGEWRNYIASFQLGERYPGIQGVGYSKFFGPEEIETITSQVRSEGFNDFHIFPAGNREQYSSILFIEPLTERNTRALGYDMYADAVRRKAMDRAWHTGEAALSGKVSLVQAEGVSEETGFLVYVPVYTAETSNNPDIQQRVLQGFSYAPFFSSTFFGTIIGKDEQHVGVRVYDEEVKQENLFYESEKYASLDNQASKSLPLTIEAYGRKWILDFRLSDETLSPASRARPLNVLIGGTLFNMLVSGLILTLLISRTRSLAISEEREVQAAKDELLALASHQLRTPATGVKQYVGMVKEGFAGKINAQQQELLDKAYESNERQLRIINELLYVAKVDAEGIVLARRKTNLSELIRDIVDEQRQELQTHGHDVRVDMPKKDVYAKIDEHCLRMAVENLLSNASKYTYEGGKILVQLKRRKGMIMILVQDNGVGIAKEDMSLLFQRFSRIPNDLSRSSTGSGIGLYLARHLVKLHGGEIEVHSKPNEGSTFTIYLPTDE